MEEYDKSNDLYKSVKLCTCLLCFKRRVVCNDCIQKIKVSHNKSHRLRAGIEGWASTVTLTFGTSRVAELATLRAATLYH